MYVSRLLFHTIPGKTGEVEKELKKLSEMVRAAGGNGPRVLHTHFASLGAADAVFEQEAPDFQTLEATDSPTDQQPGLPELEPSNVQLANAVPEARGLHS